MNQQEEKSTELPNYPIDNGFRELVELNEESSSNVDSDTEKPKCIDKHHYIGHVKEAPQFSHDNEFIHNGYRINFHSCGKITKSLCMCHNETVNVWTHLVGALFTIFMIVITTLMVGPYGTKLNTLQRDQVKRNEINFDKYSDPFYSSKPIFHNTRLILNKIIDNPELGAELIIKLEKIREALKYHNEKVKSYEEDIQCISCIEDYVRNINSIQILVSENIEKATDGSVGIFMKDFLSSINELKVVLKEKSKEENIEKVGYYSDEGIEKKEIGLPKWPILIQLICAIICLGCSSTFHLFLAYKSNVSEILARLDYAGISLLIAGSCYPPYYYMFFCSSLYLYAYLTFISVFAIAVFLISLFPKFTTSNNRKLRGILFLVLGISAGVPIAHMLLFYDPKIGTIVNPDIILWVVGGATYISGCLIFIFRFPERKFPGIFDYIGSSHQIWHIFVLSGIIIHHFASNNSYYDRLNHECSAV